MTYRVGATPAPELYSYWEPQTPINMWVRIFPLSDGTLKPWDHEQFDYCRRHNAIPFLSTKIDGDTTKLAALRQRLIDMPSWITVLYITDRHEPEGDLPVDQYRANFNLFADMIEGLPAATRAKVLYGHVLTRAWTENTAGRTYATHDTGRGDFFGVDMYAQYWSGSNAATSYPDPATFLSRVKAYRYSSSDNRPRVFPEMGAPNLPFDTDGTARAAWLQGLSDQLDTWSQASLGFRFDGWIWWNFDWTGNATGGLGTLIPYRLDHKVIGTGTSADPYRYAMLPGTATPPRLGWCPGSLSVGNTFNTYPGTQAVRIFIGATEALPSWTGSDLGPIVSAGAVPHVSFKNFDLTALVNWLNAMPAGQRLILTYHHEPEQQSGGDPTAATFRSRWLQLVQTLASHPARPRITLAVVFTHYYWENWQTQGKPDPMTFWPADAAYAIDAVGWDLYNESSSSYRDPNDMLQLCRDFSAQVGKPYLIAEWGAERITGDTSGAGCVAWMRAFVDVLRVDGALTGTWYHYGNDDLIAKNRTAERDALADLIATKNAENPPTPLSTFNSIASAHYTTAEPPPPDQPPPPTEPTPTDPTPPPPDEPPPPSSLPVTGPAAARLLRADYTILITDPYCQVLGDPLDGWTSLQVTKRWKEPGSGQIVAPAYRYIRDQLQPGCRIVVLRRVLGRQSILISGPMESILRERADDGDKGGVGVLTATFTEDMAWLGARLAYPNPALTPEQQTTDYWVYTGNPEQGMLQLVNTQAGPGALTARQVPRLIVAPFSGISGTGTIKLGPTTDVDPRERLEKLTDVLRRMATLGNGAGQPIDSLGFRTRQVGDQILFEVVRSRDLAGEVHFSFGMGNLKYYSFEQNAPKLTHPIVGGQAQPDEGASRFIRELPTTDAQQLAWGRFEGYIARPGTDPLAEMQKAATEALQEGGQNARLAVSAADTVDQRYGVHYDEGDLVSIELDIGEHVTAPVQTISIQAYPTAGEVVGTTIGDQSARYDSAWIKRMRAMDRRVGYLERRALTR